MQDPFKPTFGLAPPLFAGRDQLLDDFEVAPRVTFYTGARGAGKTAMLRAIEDGARAQGWTVISETCSKGLVERLGKSRLPELLRRFDPAARRRRMSSSAATSEASLGEQINALTDLLTENDSGGLLITVDEIHRGALVELRQLVSGLEPAFREGREVAFAAAGPRRVVGELVSDKALSFLGRAEVHPLGAIELREARQALKEPIESSGRKVAAPALETMAEGTRGYPFLIQLIGSHSWQVRPKASSISLADARAGVESALRRFNSLVHVPALKSVSAVDKLFLLAMSKDRGPSKMGDVIARMKVSKGYAGMYRQRLIDAELIKPAGHGLVGFTLPFLGEYLREHAAEL